jgi:hypothetical protein
METPHLQCIGAPTSWQIWIAACAAMALEELSLLFNRIPQRITALIIV